MRTPHRSRRKVQSTKRADHFRFCAFVSATLASHRIVTPNEKLKDASLRLRFIADRCGFIFTARFRARSSFALVEGKISFLSLRFVRIFATIRETRFVVRGQARVWILTGMKYIRGAHAVHFARSRDFREQRRPASSYHVRR